MQLKRFLSPLFCLAFSIGFYSAASGTPYAANVRNTSGSTWEFVINEAADNVTVLRDGGNALNLGALGVGRHTFDMTGFTTFDVKVQKAAPTAWTTISGAGNPFTNFTIPSGVAINTSPSNLAYFGTVYVGQASTNATVAGRSMGDGIYSLTPDMVGVDLANSFAVVADPNDTSQAKHPGFSTDGSLTSSPWRLSLDAAGNLIVADWSDAKGGIKYASPDLTTGGLVLANEDGIRPLLLNGSNQEFHGSMAAKVYSTGSVGNNLVVYGMDEDMDSDGETAINATNGNNVWKWTVGNGTDYDQPPQMWINATNIPRTTDNRQNFLNLNIGVSAGMHHNSTFNKWYLVEPRDSGDQGCVVILNAAGDGTGDTTVAWSSLQFSIDNNLDGFPAFPAVPAGNSLDIQDIFRRVRDVSITPDGKYMVLNRSVYTATLDGDWTGNGVVDARDYVKWRDNPTANGGDPAGYDKWRANFGKTTADTDAVNGGMGNGDLIIIPLDANGIPDIHVSGGKMTNVQTIQLVGNTLTHSSGAQLEFDAAGNLYIANSGLVTGNAASTAQLVQVFSPGGNWIATTSSNGTFNLASFGSGSSLGSAVPEPGTIGLALFGLMLVGVRRGNRHTQVYV